MKLIWKLDPTGHGIRTAHTETHAFRITPDHVGINLSAAPILARDEWTNELFLGDYKIIQFGFVYQHMYEVAEAYEG